MSERTNIQWADTTVNPTSGCDGCEIWHAIHKGPCYAGHYHEGRMAKALPALYDADFLNVRMAPGRMIKAAAYSDLTGKPRPDKPWLDGMPRLIFVGDMGDIFSADVTFNYLKAELIDVATSVKGSRHIWMILTKRPSRMVEFAEWLRVEHGINWPANIWAGTSVTGVRSLKRIDALRLMDAVKFVSAEPLVDDIGVPSALFGVDLIIIGGESNQGPHRGRPFDLPWPRRIIGVAKETGTAVFMKQLGSNPVDSGRRVQLAPSKAPPADWENPRDGHGDDWTTWPEDLRVRQMPAAANVASTHKENLF